MTVLGLLSQYMSKVLRTGEFTTISGVKASDETEGGKISHKLPEDTLKLYSPTWVSIPLYIYLDHSEQKI